MSTLEERALADSDDSDRFAGTTAPDQNPNPPQDLAEPARLLGHCPACHSPMYGPCGHCIAEANAAGTTFEVQRLSRVILAERDEAFGVIAAIEWLCDEAIESEHRFRGEAFVHVSDLRNALVTL